MQKFLKSMIAIICFGTGSILVSGCNGYFQGTKVPEQIPAMTTALNTAVEYLRIQVPPDAPPENLKWDNRHISIDEIENVLTLEYSAAPWEASIECELLPSPPTTFLVTIKNPEKPFSWVGNVDQNGNIETIGIGQIMDYSMPSEEKSP